jgi:anaerobic magnesium-protoporphyrin IX monomethyl ester cyclase
MMHVLLVNPPSSSVFNTFGLSLPPTGLLYVAASLEQAGHRVVVRDLAADGEQLSDRDIRDADIVGISADTTRADKALSIARRVTATGRKVVLGGPHPQFMAEDIFASGAVDYIVKGEGEIVFCNLLRALQNKESVASVKGLIIKDGRHLLETPAADPVDIETLPFPARHLVDLHRYRASMDGRPSTPLVSSRGCPGACHFCSSSSFLAGDGVIAVQNRCWLNWMRSITGMVFGLSALWMTTLPWRRSGLNRLPTGLSAGAMICTGGTFPGSIPL